MIKASNIGLEKQEVSSMDIVEETRKRFLDEMANQSEQKAFNKLNVAKEHTLEELIGLMIYKQTHIKAKIHPHIFYEVVKCLKELQEHRNSEADEIQEPSCRFCSDCVKLDNNDDVGICALRQTPVTLGSVCEYFRFKGKEVINYDG